MFEGISVAMVTPFKNGQIDEPAVERLVDFLVASAVDGLVVGATTGEGATLTASERKRLYEIVRQAASNRCRLIAGTGTNDTATTIERTREAEQAGYDAALVVSPYYNKPTPAGQIAHFKAVADSTRLPVILYNVPGRTASSMLPETIALLSEHPRIVAIKEASGSLDQISAIRRLSDITILSGDDSLTLPMLALGGKGVIATIGNVAPGEFREVLVHWEAGRIEEAEKAHLRLFPLMRALFLESNPGPAKFLLSAWGMIENELRLPMAPVEKATEAKILEAARASKVSGPARQTTSAKA
jgi:4-hydroxy-tetrahydrodipicolinate synthase